ncbi:hypothetical protein [Pleomorphovibrio marinus]|uniref:hypothetical protein n=1 Tax=Pleomorphovibrio marinus TaxID=2164132 RepID=UPI000E0A154E|nr:hypothetical protein [Pleomorphovibrio marinus]
MTHLILILLQAFIYPFVTILGQMQPDIPKPRGPVDLSDPVNVVIFILLPLIVIIAFLFWRKAMQKKRQEEEENKKNQK